MKDSRYADRLIEIISDMPEEKQKELLEDLEKKQIKKLRKYPRKKCLINVNFVVRDRVYQNYIQDINTEGAFIETSGTFEVGDHFLLIISYSKEQRPFRIEGRVVRTDPKGIGVIFKKVSQIQDEVIKSIVGKIADAVQ